MGTLTEEQKENYLQNSHICPYCQSEDITGGSIQIDGTCAWQEIKCGACEKTWTDIYTLARIEEEGD